MMMMTTAWTGWLTGELCSRRSLFLTSPSMRTNIKVSNTYFLATVVVLVHYFNLREC